MIPGNGITPAPIVGGFSFPLSEEYTPLVQRVWGGLALGDASQGRLVKLWEVRAIDDELRVSPSGEAPVLSLSAPGVLSASLAFDAAMRAVVAWTTAQGAYLYYYDAVTLDYVNRFFPGVTSARVAVDDPRPFYTASSDVIFAYTSGEMLYWRQQRDRYDEERVLGPTPGTLIKVGLSTINRLQFEIRGGEIQPIPIDYTSLEYNVPTRNLQGFSPAA